MSRFAKKGGTFYFANDMYNIAIKIMQGPKNSPVIEKTGRMKEDGSETEKNGPITAMALTPFDPLFHLNPPPSLGEPRQESGC